MSLFAGVNFRTDPNRPKEDAPAVSSITAAPAGAPADKTVSPQISETPSAAAPVQWSAALRFAPAAASRKRTTSAGVMSSVPGQAQGAIGSGIKTGGLKSISTTAVPASVTAPAPSAPFASSSIPHLPGLSTSTSLPTTTQSSFIAAPTPASSSAVPMDYASTDAQGRKVFKPPAMTLDPSAIGSGSGGGQARKRPAEQMTGGGGGSAGGRSKKKGRKNAGLFANPETLPFDPHEPYNPSRPTDLTEYKAYRKQYREERRQREREEEARKKADRSSGGMGAGAYPASDESSYYSEDEDDEKQPAPTKGWAPPVGLYGSTAGPGAATSSTPALRRPPPEDDGDEYGSYTAPRPGAATCFTAPSFAQASAPPAPSYSTPQASAPIQALSGEEAYQRRLALSQQKSETADEAYARRVAMSTGAGGGGPTALPSFASSSGTAYVPPPMAMPQAAPPAFTAPAIAAPASPLGDYVDLTFGEADGIPAPSKEQSAPGASTMTDDFAKKLEERKAAAAAIAAKFAAIAPPPPLKDEDPEDLVERMAREVERETAENSGTFAEKMMRRWGHQEGQGLGKDGTGIVHAFSAEHVNSSTTISSNNAKKSKANLSSGGSGQWVQSNSSKGRLVNLNEDERKKDEKEKYGEPSRIVLLRNVVGRVEDADEELSGEIGEECGKNGIVERVVLHPVTPAPEDPSEGLRIFIQFSGLAGAWRTLKEMDGRFFGGRQVRATYFDEGRFVRGDRSGTVL